MGTVAAAMFSRAGVTPADIWLIRRCRGVTSESHLCGSAVPSEAVSRWCVKRSCLRAKPQEAARQHRRPCDLTYEMTLVVVSHSRRQRGQELRTDEPLIGELSEERHRMGNPLLGSNRMKVIWQTPETARDLHTDSSRASRSGVKIRPRHSYADVRWSPLPEPPFFCGTRSQKEGWQIASSLLHSYDAVQPRRHQRRRAVSVTDYTARKTGTDGIPDDMETEQARSPGWRVRVSTSPSLVVSPDENLPTSLASQSAAHRRRSVFGTRKMSAHPQPEPTADRVMSLSIHYVYFNISRKVPSLRWRVLVVVLWPELQVGPSRRPRGSPLPAANEIIAPGETLRSGAAVTHSQDFRAGRLCTNTVRQ
ncbi:hypothetical protein DPEC_G00368070 [Dallia pectoralis]|nr:hypothetical protein DPEC_G00368070 [Dallia pectoralis]